MCIVTFKVDDEVKAKAQNIFNELGLSMSAALNIFLKSCINNNGIPFDLKILSTEIPNSNDIPNAKTAQAIEEGDKIANDPNVKGYSNIEDLKKALDL